MSTNQQKLSAGQRAIYFQQATRQNIMSLNKKTAENNSIVFELPKARYLATLYLDVTAKIKCTHSWFNEFCFCFFSDIDDCL